HVVFVQPAVAAVSGLADDRDGHEIAQSLADTNGAGAGTTAAMRRGERLVQIHVDDVEAHVAGPHLAEDGIQFGAIVIQQAAGFVDNGRDVLDVLFEPAQRGRVRQHDAGSLRTNGGFQHLDVNIAVRVGGYFTYRAAA